jgi:hypothetical protein
LTGRAHAPSAPRAAPQVAQLQAALAKQGVTLRQAELLAKSSASEAAVAARKALSADAAAGRTALVKSEQDTLLDTLTAQLLLQQEQRAASEASLAAARMETDALKVALSRVTAEMASVHADQKALVAHWKTSVLAASRRDDVLAACRTALVRMGEEESGLEAELRGARRAEAEEAARAEALAERLARVERDERLMATRLDAHASRAAELKSEQDMLNAQLADAEAEAAAALQRATALDEEARVAHAAAVAAEADCVEAQAQALRMLSEGSTVERGAQNAAAAITELRTQQAEALAGVTAALDDASRSRAEEADLQAAVARNADALAVADAALAAQQAAMDACEADTKRFQDDTERKEREMDRLNRALEKLLSAVVEDNLGPLEATVANLVKEIAAKGADTRELQRTWIGLQSELVGLAGDAAASAERAAELRAERGVLAGKAKRLQAAATADGAETVALSRFMEQGHADVVRLAAAATRSLEVAAAAEAETRATQEAVDEAVAAFDEQTAALEARAKAAREEERASVAAASASHGMAAVWEDKISLERDIQAELDPNVGAADISELRREMHRLELRRAELAKKHERAGVELERAVARREVITSKTVAAAAMGKKSSPWDRTRTELERTIREAEKELAASDARTRELQRAAATLAPEIAAAHALLERKRAEAALAAEELGRAERAAAVATAATAASNRAVRMYENIAAGRAAAAPVAAKDRQRVAEARDALSAAAEAVARLHPELEAHVEAVRAMLRADAPLPC